AAVRALDHGERHLHGSSPRTVPDRADVDARTSGSRRAPASPLRSPEKITWANSTVKRPESYPGREKRVTEGIPVRGANGDNVPSVATERWSDSTADRGIDPCSGPGRSAEVPGQKGSVSKYYDVGSSQDSGSTRPTATHCHAHGRPRVRAPRKDAPHRPGSR